MLWILFALGAALSWGLYGPALHRGQVALGNPMRALLCVGVAYFLIGVLVPVVSFLHRASSMVSHEGHGRRDAGRCVGRGGSCLHHLGIQIGRVADVCDAACFCGSAAGQRVVFDVAASAEDFAESVALFGVCFGCAGWWFGALLQAAVLVGIFVSPHRFIRVFSTRRRSE